MRYFRGIATTSLACAVALAVFAEMHFPTETFCAQDQCLTPHGIPAIAGALVGTIVGGFLGIIFALLAKLGITRRAWHDVVAASILANAPIVAICIYFHVPFALTGSDQVLTVFDLIEGVGLGLFLGLSFAIGARGRRTPTPTA